MATTLPYRSAPDRRFAALALTALVHVLLLLGWQAARRMPPLDLHRDTRRIQWINLAPLAPAERRRMPPPPEHAPERKGAPARTPAAPSAVIAPTAPPAAITLVPAAPTASAGTAAAPAPPPAPVQAADGGPLVQRALHQAGVVDRALRKENNPYIVAPPDSPQIRMRRDMEAAHAAVPNAWYQAPKIDELVNNTGDGARRTRVRTGNGTYCVTDRAPTSSIDTIEILGKQRFTNCPEHESPANAQEWKTARDP